MLLVLLNPNLAQPSFPTSCQCSLHFTLSAALTESPTRFTCKTQRTPKLCQVFLQQHELFFAFKIPQVNLQKRKRRENNLQRPPLLSLPQRECAVHVNQFVCDVAQLQEQHDKHIKHTLAGSLKVTRYAQLVFWSVDSEIRKAPFHSLSCSTFAILRDITCSSGSQPLVMSQRVPKPCQCGQGLPSKVVVL